MLSHLYFLSLKKFFKTNTVHKISYCLKSYKMNKLPTNLEAITLNEQTNFRLNEINKIKDYFVSEIKEQETIIKKLSKYITGFDYTDKILTAFFDSI